MNDAVAAALQFPDVARPDAAAQVVYLPVRHHSPACAFHVERVIAELQPTFVLIEGPRDANALIRHLADARTRPPIALYTTFIDRSGEGQPRHFGSYYPLCDYSPELVALRAAAAVGAEARFIDLTFAELLVAEARHATADEADARPPITSLQNEAYLRHSRLLRAACERAGARDPDDLWDCLFEHDFRRKDSATFFHEVLVWCALTRHDHTPEMIAAEAHDVREAAMSAEIGDAVAAAAGGRVVVVTGGFHSVALPTTPAQRPRAVKLAKPDDAAVTLIRYGFQQLDRLNGYASGMPAPEFYQRSWEARDVSELLAELARLLRRRDAVPSTADVTAAAEQLQRLARFRDHATPTREDVLDAVRSLYVKGAADIEGVTVLAAAHKLLAGDRVGEVAPDVGRPALVVDFDRIVRAEKLSLDVDRDHEATLDLYRSAAHRGKSRFFHRLRLLEIPFAEWLRGPDYVAGKDLDRVNEVWRYHWRPATEAQLVEQSRFGATIEEAAAAIVSERFAAAEQSGRRADVAARLVLEACRAGLHDHAALLVTRTAALVGADPDFSSVVAAAVDLDLLRISREPLEAQQLTGLLPLVRQAWERAALLVTQLGTTPEEQETTVLDSLCTWTALSAALPDRELAAMQRTESLRALLGAGGDANPTLLGCAFGLLYDDGVIGGDELGRRLGGYLGAATSDATHGARFLRGVLRAARSACWQEASLVDALHGALAGLPEPAFLAALPHLRLAFADLTPRECDRVAAAAAVRCGVAQLPSLRMTRASAADLLLGARADALVADVLRRDGGTLEGDGDGAGAGNGDG